MRPKQWLPDEQVRSLAKGISIEDVSSITFSGHGFGQPFVDQIDVTDRIIVEQVINALLHSLLPHPPGGWLAPLKSGDTLVIHFRQNLSAHCQPVTLKFNAGLQPFCQDFVNALKAVGGYMALKTRQQIDAITVPINKIDLDGIEVTEQKEINRIILALGHLSNRAFAYTEADAVGWLIRLIPQAGDEFYLYLTVAPFQDLDDDVSNSLPLPTILWDYFKIAENGF